MKILTFIAICLCSMVFSGKSARAEDTNVGGHYINFANVPVGKVLDFYKELTGLDLVVARNVPVDMQGITLRADGASTTTATKMVEQALLKQKGIIITRLDDKRASVTYNDQLPLQK